MKDFSNKKVAILGFGVEGQSTARFLAQNGANVTVFDEKAESAHDSQKITSLRDLEVNFIFGKIDDLAEYDLLVRSPGISLTHPIFQNVPTEKITSATKLFFDLCPCPIIGVTGTKGKGTTSSLIYEMLKASGFAAFIGGNIGVPPLEFLEQLTPDSKVVLELSSFQLADLHKSPHIAVMLMVTSEHLDYHKDVTEYVAAKRNILRFQTANDFSVLNRDYPASNESDIYTDAQVFFVSREREVEQGCFVERETIILRKSGRDEKIIDTKDIALVGKHNWENVCSAVMAAALAGVRKDKMVEVLKSFKGLEHRLELIRIVNGVRYFDDSFSTTPETAEAAIEAFEDPEILILGGSSKNSDFTELGKVISDAENIKAIIGIGVEWGRIKEQIHEWHFQIVENLTTMDEVVKKAAELAQPGDVVLLSPACASFDMFANYKERGDTFKKAVSSL